MGCLGGDSEHKAKPGRYRCKKCGGVSKKKGHVCKPKKIKIKDKHAAEERPPID